MESLLGTVSFLALFCFYSFSLYLQALRDVLHGNIIQLLHQGHNLLFTGSYYHIYCCFSLSYYLYGSMVTSNRSLPGSISIQLDTIHQAWCTINSSMGFIGLLLVLILFSNSLAPCLPKKVYQKPLWLHVFCKHLIFLILRQHWPSFYHQKKENEQMFSSCMKCFHQIQRCLLCSQQTDVLAKMRGISWLNVLGCGRTSSNI